MNGAGKNKVLQITVALLRGASNVVAGTITE
jgi:hypothetical protein